MAGGSGAASLVSKGHERGVHIQGRAPAQDPKSTFLRGPPRSPRCRRPLSQPRPAASRLSHSGRPKGIPQCLPHSILCICLHAGQGLSLSVPTWPARTGTHRSAWPLGCERAIACGTGGHRCWWGCYQERSPRTEVWGLRGRAVYAGWVQAVVREGPHLEAKAEDAALGFYPSPQRVLTKKGTGRAQLSVQLNFGVQSWGEGVWCGCASATCPLSFCWFPLLVTFFVVNITNSEEDIKQTCSLIICHK